MESRFVNVRVTLTGSNNASHGECLKHHGRCEEINGTWAMHRRRKGKVKIRFTVAHLCHKPECDDRSHLRAMCEPCHLIYDLRCDRVACAELMP